MANDYRTVSAAVKTTIKELGAKDPNWKWKAVVTKAEVKIYWSYLEYKGNTPPFIITDGTVEKGECLEDTKGEFVVLRNEHDEYLSGRILGCEEWADGTLEQAVVSLMRGLQAIVNSTY